MVRVVGFSEGFLAVSVLYEVCDRRSTKPQKPLSLKMPDNTSMPQIYRDTFWIP